MRQAGTGRLVQVLEGEDIRLVQSQAGCPLMIAKRGNGDNKKGMVDELVELLETAPLEVTPRSAAPVDGSAERLWDEWDQ